MAEKHTIDTPTLRDLYEGLVRIDGQS